MTTFRWLALWAGIHAFGCVASTDADDACEPDEVDCGGGDDGGGGKADGQAGQKAQMNDLTEISPLPGSTAELNAMLTASSAGAHGALLPKATYTGVFPDRTGGVGADVGMKFANLRVVAMRIDPCFANVGPVTDPASCDNQIRLVFQDVTLAGGKGSAVDGAVHVFYRMPRTELLAVMREVIDLRVAQGQTRTLGPLAPHPLLVKQGLTGAYAKGLAKIILAHCGADRMFRFTHFQSGNLQTTWAFSGFDVAGTHTTPMVIPTLPAGTTSVSFFAGFSAQLAGGFTPETKSDDSVAILGNAEKAKAASASAQRAAFGAALRIENPDFHSPNTIDCASCHVAQIARVKTGTDVLHLAVADGDDDSFTADPKFVSKTNMKQTTSPRQANNLHMLSYRSTSLMINQRVINETAAVVTYVNGELHP